ncbi:MAG TPA: excinuclease ABC subunit B, partial [Gammaproteobacteria bacterium]|nr:excinuclease ABC subunit B [Gammaproteobacteria bacterium]
IFDADKEGFLRSDRSLIQTIGRAARNAEGRAILYADKITGSMQRAMEETDRRRTKQIEFNEANGITPQTVARSIEDILEGSYAPGKKITNKKAGKQKTSEVAERSPEYLQTLSPQAQAQELKKIENQMLEHAKNLEFEDAARLRDELNRLKEALLIM